MNIHHDVFYFLYLYTKQTCVLFIEIIISSSEGKVSYCNQYVYYCSFLFLGMWNKLITKHSRLQNTIAISWFQNKTKVGRLIEFWL